LWPKLRVLAGLLRKMIFEFHDGDDPLAATPNFAAVTRSTRAYIS
jgi:hypothetical protein